MQLLQGCDGRQTNPTSQPLTQRCPFPVLDKVGAMHRSCVRLCTPLCVLLEVDHLHPHQQHRVVLVLLHGQQLVVLFPPDWDGVSSLA